MKIVVFSKVPVFPPYGGNRSRILSLCNELRALGGDIDFFLIPSRQMKDYSREEHEKFFGPDMFHVLRRTSFETLLFYLKVIFYSGERLTRLGKRKKVTNVDYLWQSCLEPQIRGIFRSSNAYDICVVEYVHFSKIFELVPQSTFKILDTHDSFSEEFTAEAEATGLARADRVLAIQNQEASDFQKILGPDADKVCVISHFINETDPIDVSHTLGATFLGSKFAANLVSLRYFIKEVLPLIQAAVPDFKLYVAGDITSAIEDHPCVVKLGRVQQVADAYVRAPILVSPVRAGTGVKIKLLEAMGLGIPCVSTQSGVRGLDEALLTGIQIVADGDASAFARQVVQLVRDKTARIALGQQAQRTALRWSDKQRAQLQVLLSEAHI